MCLAQGGPGAYRQRPYVLFSSAVRKRRILYYLLFFISYFNSLLRVLAVVAGLGADVNIIAGQVGAQAHILALVANGKAPLVVFVLGGVVSANTGPNTKTLVYTGHPRG